VTSRKVEQLGLARDGACNPVQYVSEEPERAVGAVGTDGDIRRRVQVPGLLRRETPGLEADLAA